MRKQTQLFDKSLRECVCCGVGQSPITARNPSVPLGQGIIAISPMIYRRGARAAQLANAGKVRICENCLSFALSTPSGREARTIGRALLERVSTRYSALLDEDAA